MGKNQKLEEIRQRISDAFAGGRRNTSKELFELLCDIPSETREYALVEKIFLKAREMEYHIELNKRYTERFSCSSHSS